MISEDRLQQALTYLATTDKPAAQARALMIGLEEQRKTVKSMEFLDASGPVAERDAKAYSSKSYRDHIAKLEQATEEYELLRNKRLTEQLVVEVWRSINANQRRGNI